MAAEEDHTKERIRRNALKASKAAVKAAIVYVIYLIVAQLLEPVSLVIPSFQQMILGFTIVYIILMIIGDLTSGTVFQHFFNAARALFVMVYMIFMLNTGTFEANLGGASLIVDLRPFLAVAMLMALLGLAKSVLQAVNYVHEKAEPACF